MLKIARNLRHRSPKNSLIHFGDLYLLRGLQQFIQVIKVRWLFARIIRLPVEFGVLRKIVDFHVGFRLMHFLNFLTIIGFIHSTGIKYDLYWLPRYIELHLYELDVQVYLVGLDRLLMSQ